MEDEPSLGRSTPTIIAGRSPCDRSAHPGAIAILTSLVVSDELETAGDERRTFFQCGGVLIAPDVVLTAAHCLDIATIEDAQIFVSVSADLQRWVGTPTLPPNAVRVAHHVAHPSFPAARERVPARGLDQVFDIALLFLETPLLREHLAYPPDTELAIPPSPRVRMAGWGQTRVGSNPFDPDSRSTSSVLHCAESEIAELGESEFHIAGDSTTARKCHGDSGGPTYIASPMGDIFLIGITSRAYDREHECELGSIDTRVDAYLEWIDAELRAGCIRADRAFCEVPGLIPRSLGEPWQYTRIPGASCSIDGGIGDPPSRVSLGA